MGCQQKYKFADMEIMCCAWKSATGNLKKNKNKKLGDIIRKRCTDRKQPRGCFFFFSCCFCGGLMTILIAASNICLTFCKCIRFRKSLRYVIKYSSAKSDQDHLADQNSDSFNTNDHVGNELNIIAYYTSLSNIT